MLKLILMVTISVPNLGVVSQAYSRYLGYRIIESGKISTALAATWGTPAVAGRNYLVMRPGSGEEVFLRFIQSEPTDGYAPLKTYGWNSTELLVQNVDELAKQLEGSPFNIIGPPRNLSSSEDIRAMQVQGPADEILYLTQIMPGQDEFHLGSAKTPVDRMFIMVLGGKNIKKMLKFYADKLKMPVTKPAPVRISVLSKAHGLDPETMHDLALVRFPERFLIEVDKYPKTATDRPQRVGDLPPGVAMVSFLVPSLDSLRVKWAQPPATFGGTLYRARRVAVTTGAAGEMIELIEQRPF